MMNIQRAFVILALFISVIFVSAIQGCETGITNECNTNSDCIKTQLTCCPCSMGGVEQCLPAPLASMYIQKNVDCPSQDQLVCTAVYNCKIKSCKCVSGKCNAEESK